MIRKEYTAKEEALTRRGKVKRRETVGSKCTLNGINATVCMNEAGFAVIGQLSAPFQAVEYSWTAVWNTLENRGGKFSSY